MNPNTNTWNRLRYGLYAPCYDLVAKRLDRGRKRSIERLNMQPGQRVLIVGAGTGLDFPHLPTGLDVTAVDLSPAMIGKASTRAQQLGLDVDCHVMDAHRLDLPNEAFDVVLLHLILAVVPDPQATIRETARVLKPGGRVGIFDKFLPDDAQPSYLRRAAGMVTNLLFTDINRRLGPLLAEADLVIAHEEPALFGGLFKVVIAQKSATSAPFTTPHS
ncbi:MAG TPA: methyltransferase domain-containing protein [Rhodothermales bacterium]|nr:methyltransferase domain-containing protein [Rhodothermales bacterium]